jgi:small subunit ribosomal protein S16
VLAIRLSRLGTKNKPFYRVVVSEAARATGSRVTALLGYYDPRRKPEVVKIDVPRAEAWIAKGAQASHTVRRLIERARSAQV